EVGTIGAAGNDIAAVAKGELLNAIALDVRNGVSVIDPDVAHQEVTLAADVFNGTDGQRAPSLGVYFQRFGVAQRDRHRLETGDRLRLENFGLGAVQRDDRAGLLSDLPAVVLLNADATQHRGREHHVALRRLVAAARLQV